MKILFHIPLTLTAVWLAFPILAVAGVAFCEPLPEGEIGRFGSFAGFHDVMRLGLLRSILPTAPAAVLGSILATVFAFTSASLTRLRPVRLRRSIVALMTIPMLTSIVPRAFALTDVLVAPGRHVEQALLNARLFGSEAAPGVIIDIAVVTLGYSYTYIPYLFFIFWVALEDISDNQLAAARDGGAKDLDLMRRLFWPSVFPLAVGISLLSTVLMTLDIVVPSLFGSGKVLYVGPAVEFAFFRLRLRPTAVAFMLSSALAAVAVAILVLGFLLLSMRLVRLAIAKSALRRAPANG